MPVSLLAPQACHAPCSSRTICESQPAWTKLVRDLTADFQLFGLDIVQPLCLGWYNAAVPEDLGVRIPTPITPGDSTLALLVGNSKNIWSPFLEACKCDPDLLADPNPLDIYVERTISAALLVNSTHRLSYRCFWSHTESDELSGSRYVAIQRMAQAAGLAYLDQQTHLCLHSKFGSWFGLRCVLVFDGIEYTGPRKPHLPYPLPLSTQEYVKLAIRCAQRQPSNNSLQEKGKWAMDVHIPAKDNTQASNQWKKWVTVREALCPCHPWRYCEDQLEYHYTKSKQVLEKSVARLQS